MPLKAAAFLAGYKNRYNKHNIFVFNTANEGAIGLSISRERGLVEVSGYRNDAVTIWRATVGARVATIPEFQYDSLMLRQQDAKLDEAKNQCLN